MADPAGPTTAGGPAAARIERLGDAALLVVLGDAVDGTLNRAARLLAADLAAAAAGGVGLGVPVPAYASVLVPFDPLRLPEDQARAAVEATLAAAAVDAPDEAPLVTIRVRYGGADGPDLDDVAARVGLPPADVVALHAGSEYRVFCLGFSPGFPYLGSLPPALELPRRPTPRVRVPAGSVAIAGRQTGIYPAETPGGWHLLGRTDAVLWDPLRDPPALLAPGTRVRFEPA